MKLGMVFNEAIDKLVKERKISYEIRQLYDAQRNSYNVGVYRLID